jgi:hypothetical protein
MARARNIKPGLYKNEDLAECSVWARLIFPGLWMLADRDGRMEDRPKRIKGELLPYDSIEVEPLLAELEQRGFIRRYAVGADRFISIIKFLEHQTPHGTERDGTCPDENGLLTANERGKNGYITGKFELKQYALTVKEQGSVVVKNPVSSLNSGLTVNDASQDGGENTLIPDFLIPDSLSTDTGTQEETAVVDPDHAPEETQHVASSAERSVEIAVYLRQRGIVGANSANPNISAWGDDARVTNEILDAALSVVAGRNMDRMPGPNYLKSIIADLLNPRAQAPPRGGSKRDESRAAAAASIGLGGGGHGRDSRVIEGNFREVS